MLFFFSSRRRHTRFDCDWSSDVCSSDLPVDTVSLRRPSLDDVFLKLTGRAIREEEVSRSEEHTSELQSQSNLVCRLLLEKKKQTLNSKVSTRFHSEILQQL